MILYVKRKFGIGGLEVPLNFCYTIFSILSINIVGEANIRVVLYSLQEKISTQKIMKLTIQPKEEFYIKNGTQEIKKWIKYVTSTPIVDGSQQLLDNNWVAFRHKWCNRPTVGAVAAAGAGIVGEKIIGGIENVYAGNISPEALAAMNGLSSGVVAEMGNIVNGLTLGLLNNINNFVKNNGHLYE